jgi:hypothetical protein
MDKLSELENRYHLMIENLENTHIQDNDYFYNCWKESYDELSIFFMNPKASFENLLKNTK